MTNAVSEQHVRDVHDRLRHQPVDRFISQALTHYFFSPREVQHFQRDMWQLMHEKSTDRGPANMSLRDLKCMEKATAHYPLKIMR